MHSMRDTLLFSLISILAIMTLGISTEDRQPPFTGLSANPTALSFMATLGAAGASRTGR